MKFFVGLLFALAISSTVGLPAGNPNDDAEYVYIPPSRKESSTSSPVEERPDFKDFTGVIDTGSSGFPERGGNPFSPFGGDGFSDGISDFMRRFREKVFSRWWQNVPTLDVADLDPSKGNTTSVVKFVDGHRVEVNDTVYTNNDNSGNSFYKVRLINIRPLDSDEESTTTASESGEEAKKTSPETANREDVDNEINETYSSTESTTQLHELPTTLSTESEVETIESTTSISSQVEPVENDDDLIENFESIDDKEKPEQKYSEKLEAEEETVPQERFIAPLNSELFDEDEDTQFARPVSTGSEWDSFQEGPINNENNNIDYYESIPVNLSNDIDINQMLADQGAPTNPDAEVFTVPESYVQESQEQTAPHLKWFPNKRNENLYWPKRK